MKIGIVASGLLVLNLLVAEGAIPELMTNLPPRAVRREPPPSFLTLDTADADYALQGEYVNDAKHLGAQIIALGSNQFRLVLFNGGLPGAGWDKSAKTELSGRRDGEQVIFTNAEHASFAADGGVLMGGSSGEKTEYRRIVRSSPRLGAKPPPGAIILFDGSNCDAWQDGKFDELGRKLLACGTKTKALFTNFTLHVEFLLPFKPLGRGQDRGNSGIYIQDRYEVQVLDSFGLAGANNECGAIYTRTAPAVNLCFPPLVWQTYDIDFTAPEWDAAGHKTKNAVISVNHNGVMIHEHQMIEGQTGNGQKEAPTGGPIQLQAHNNSVFYQNIWIVSR